MTAMGLALWAWAAVATADDRVRFETWVDHLPPDENPALTGGYRFTEQLWVDVAAAVRAYPGNLRVEHLGVTHDNRPMWAFHCASPLVDAHRRVLVIAGLHAMEWITTEVAVEGLALCAAKPEYGVSVTFVPLVNPDGRSKVEADLRAGETRWRRGNRVNVDLNRDFAYNREPRAVWAKLPGSRVFYEPTPDALSQPESRAIDALADRYRFHRAASLHAFGGFLYYPWAGRFQRTPDWRAFHELGYAMAAAQGGRRAYRVRQLGRNLFFFRAQGAEIDHLYGVYGARAWLVELTRSGATARNPGHFWPYFRRYNPEDRETHIGDGQRALAVLYRYPTQPGEVGEDGAPVVPPAPRRGLTTRSR